LFLGNLKQNVNLGNPFKCEIFIFVLIFIWFLILIDVVKLES